MKLIQKSLSHILRPPRITFERFVLAEGYDLEDPKSVILLQKQHGSQLSPGK